MPKKSSKTQYSVYLRVRPDSDDTKDYDKSFVNILKSFGTFESQSGIDCNSFNGSDEGYELFAIDIKSFKEAKSIALKCANLWKVGVVELSVDDHSFCIKYSEPTIVGRTVPFPKEKAPESSLQRRED